VKRQEATRRLEELLTRVSVGGDLYLDAVEEISVFGSYAAGALMPNDVDIAVEFRDPTGRIAEEQVQRMLAGRSWSTPFEQALRGRQRGMSIVFNQRQQLERQGGFEFVALWRRGENVELAFERLRAIQSNPEAGSARRDHVHPAIVGFERRASISARERLIELDRQGAITVRRFDIEREREPQDANLRRRAGWGYSDASPRRRAMRALLAHLEAEGVAVESNHREVILVRDLKERAFASVQHGAERLEAALDDAQWRFGRSYCILNLTGRAPFAVLEIAAHAFTREATHRDS
jgi:hypothetical protein